MEKRQSSDRINCEDPQEENKIGECRDENEDQYIDYVDVWLYGAC